MPARNTWETKPLAWSPKTLRANLLETLTKHSKLPQYALKMYVNDKVYPRQVKVSRPLLRRIQKHFVENAHLILSRYENLGRPDGLFVREGDRCYFDARPEKILLAHSVFQQKDFPQRGVWIHRLYYLKRFLSLNPQKEKEFWETFLKVYRDEPVCEFEDIALEVIQEFVDDHGKVLTPLWVILAYYKALTWRSILIDHHKAIYPDATSQAVREFFARASVTARWTIIGELLSLVSASKRFATWVFNYSYDFIREIINERLGYEPEIIIEEVSPSP